MLIARDFRNLLAYGRLIEESLVGLIRRAYVGKIIKLFTNFIFSTRLVI